MRIKTFLLIALLSFIFVASQYTVNTDELYDDYPDTTENSTSNESTQEAKVDTSSNNQLSSSNSSSNTSSSNEESNSTDMNSTDNNNIDNDDITWDDDTESEANTESSSASVESTQNNNLQTSTQSENNSNTTSQETNISSNPENDDITFDDDTSIENNSEVSSSSESNNKTETTNKVETNQTNENNSSGNNINQENNNSSNIVNDDITWDDDTNDESNTETATISNESTTKTESNGVQNNNETANNSSQNQDDDEFSWETTDSEENSATEKNSREANNDKFLSENQNTSTVSNNQNQNELNFEEPMAEESSEAKKTSGLNVKCFWFNGHNETFDLSPLDNRTEDKKIEVTAKKNYFYNFCNPTVVKCNEGLNLMRLEKDDKCTVVAGNEGKTFSEFEKMTKKEIVDEKEKEIIVGLRVKLASGEKCAADETKTYLTTWEISCDEDKEAKKGVITVLNAADLDLDQPGRVDKCSLVVKAKSVHGCPLSNYYAVSAFMEANKIIFMIVIVVIGIFLTYLGSKILNITLMITAFFATVIGVFLVVFGIFGAYKISNGIMWLIFSLTILLAGGVGFLFYKFKQIFSISLGGLTGYFCSMMLYNFVLRYIKSNPDVVYWVTLVVCVGLGILVAIYLEKHLIITSTALLGGYATVRGASLVIGGFPPESEVIDLIRKGEFYQLSLVSI